MGKRSPVKTRSPQAGNSVKFFTGKTGLQKSPRLDENCRIRALDVRAGNLPPPPTTGGGVLTAAKKKEQDIM
jgi:hypothetical protein